MSMLALTVMAPFLIKSSVTGFVSPEWARSEKCEVFDNHILMTRTYSDTSIEYIFPFETHDSIAELIEKASQEKLKTEPNYLCDGPSTNIKALVMKDGVESDLVLYSTGGCGSPRKTRQGPYSAALMDIASTFCPKTH